MTTSESIFQWLEKEGYNPHFDEDKNICFKVDRIPYIFFHDDKDERFLRFCIPGVFDVTDDNQENMLRYINEINMMFKSVKAILTPTNNVWIISESWSNAIPEYGDILPQIFDMMKDAVIILYDLINGGTEPFQSSSTPL